MSGIAHTDPHRIGSTGGRRGFERPSGVRRRAFAECDDRVGKVSEEKQELMKVAEQSLFKGIEKAKARNHVHDISAAVQSCVEDAGFSVVRELVGHGVGRELHEDPAVPNFGTAGTGIVLQSGMTLAIEPMVNCGTHRVRIDADGWTVRTADGKPSAHFEHTVLITESEPEILTR